MIRYSGYMYISWYFTCICLGMSITSKLYGGIVEPLEVKAACTWDKN